MDKKSNLGDLAVNTDVKAAGTRTNTDGPERI